VHYDADGPCRILGDTMTTEGAGTCTITATQPGDIDWLPAQPVTRTASIARASQAIRFEALPDTAFGTAPVPLAVGASSGLTVTFEANGPCHVVDGKLVTEGAGICVLTASQQGDDDWQPAPPFQRAFRIERAPQILTFPPLGPQLLGSPPIELEATSSSGLPITFDGTGPCSVEGHVLTLLDVGECTVTAYQPGDADREAAPEVSRSFAIVEPVTGGLRDEAGPADETAWRRLGIDADVPIARWVAAQEG